MKLSLDWASSIWGQLLSCHDAKGSLVSRGIDDFEMSRHVTELSLRGEFAPRRLDDSGLRTGLTEEGMDPDSWLDQSLLDLGFPLFTNTVEVSACVLAHSALELHCDEEPTVDPDRTRQRTSRPAACGWQNPRTQWPVQCSLLFPIRNGVSAEEYAIMKAGQAAQNARQVIQYYQQNAQRLMSKGGDQPYLRQGLIQYPYAEAFDQRETRPLAFFELTIGQDFLLIPTQPHAAWYTPEMEEGLRTKVVDNVLAMDQLVIQEKIPYSLRAGDLCFSHWHNFVVDQHTPSIWHPSCYHLEVNIAAPSLVDALSFLREWYPLSGNVPSAQVQYMLDHAKYDPEY